jgi:hypothetical protein
MVVEDRKRKKYGKATGIMSLILAADVLAMAVTSRSVILSLESLSNGLVTGNTFVLLDVLGGAFAILTGFLLLRFKHFSKISFAIACGFGIFFGLTLPLIDVVHLSGSYLSVVMVEGVLALGLAVVVMVLSILF